MQPSRHLLNLARGWYRTSRFVAGRAPLRMAVFSLFALFAAWQLLSSAPALNEFRDAHVLGHYETVARDLVVRWHQAPLWDPYYCGGMYLLGTPQARFVSPTFLLSMVFGEARGEALTAFVMMAVGLEGAFRYARDRGATQFASMLAAPVFALSGVFAVSPALGWFGFFGFELVPWIAFGVRRALARDVRGIVVTAVAMAWCVGIGGTYAAPMAALWCGFEALEHVARRARPRRGGRLAGGLAVLGAATLLATGLAAVRLWPIAETLRTAPRIIGGTPGNDLATLAKMLFFGPAKDTDNGSFFIGGFVVPVALIGLRRRSALWLALAGALCVWLAGGYAIHPSLFAALRELPLYTTLRYPERFLVLLALAMTALAARGVTFLEAWPRTRRTRTRPWRPWLARAALAAAATCLLVDVAPLVQQHVLHANGRTLVAPPATDEASRPFHQSRGNRWALAYYEPMARGSLSCWEAYPVPESPLLRGDLTQEEYVVEHGAGTVTETRWSPDRIDLDVDLSRPATIAVNQNWHSGWRANVGEVKSDRGLLTVAMPAGRRSLTLRFSPRSATGGALTSLVALLGLAYLLVRPPELGSRRGALVLAGVTIAPLAPLLAVAALVHERPAPPVTTAMDGRPIVVDDVAEGNVRINVRFAAGVTLEAATLSNYQPRAGTDVTFELDWKRDPKIDKGLGVFVHIEPSSGDTMGGDHVLLSSVLDLEDAPPGKTLRDVMPLWVPDDARGKTWKVWVGLWRVRQGGERVPVVDPGQAEAADDRVLAATFEVR